MNAIIKSVMHKKLFIIVSVVILFGMANTCVFGQCRIIWQGNGESGPVSGSEQTEESSRTQQAALEMLTIIKNDVYNYPVCDENYYFRCDASGCYEGCYHYDSFLGPRGVDYSVTTDGSWYAQYYARWCPTACIYSSGEWDVECETLIRLSSFTADPFLHKVIIKWSTESEIDNAGFNIYRAEGEGGEYIKINAALISAKGTATQGAGYEFIDKNVRNRKTYWYKLEDIDINGVSTLHGPIKVTPRIIHRLFQ